MRKGNRTAVMLYESYFLRAAGAMWVGRKIIGVKPLFMSYNLIYVIIENAISNWLHSSYT